MTKTKDSIFQRHGVAIYSTLCALLMLAAVARIGQALMTGVASDPWSVWPTLLAVPFGLAAFQAADVRRAARARR